MTNIEKLPKQIRDDVEDQSLDILQHIQQHIVVIGGWAVRSYTTKTLKHARYTLDVEEEARKKFPKKKLSVILVPKREDLHCLL